VARVLRIAKLEGGSVVVVGGLSLVISALTMSPVGLIVSALIVTCGWAELRGARMVAAGDVRGMDWLVRAELGLMATVLLYVGFSWLTLNPATSAKELAGHEAELRQVGIDMRDLQAMTASIQRLVYAVVAVVTVIFQGGLARYYHSRRAAVAMELAMQPANNPMLSACPVCHRTVSRAAKACPHCGHPLAPTV
jgi:hypothetical protein